MKTIGDYQIEITYDDYEQSMIIKAWGYQIKYTYNMLPPEIRENFANLDDLFCQLKEQNGKIQIQTNGFIEVTLLSRIKQYLFKEGQIQEIGQKNIPQKQLKVEPKMKKTIGNEKELQIPTSYKNGSQQQDIVDSRSDALKSNILESIQILHRKNNLQCQYIQFLQKSYNSESTSYQQPCAQQKQEKSITERESQIQDLQNSNSLDQLSLKYMQIGQAYLGEGQYQIALYYLKQAKDNWQQNKQNKNQDYLYILETIGELYLKHKMHQQSLSVFTESLTLRHKMNSVNMTDVQCRTLNFMGIIYFQLQKYQKARQHFLDSLNILTKINQNSYCCYKAVVYNNIAHIYNVQRKDTEAIIYYGQAINLYFSQWNSTYSKNIGDSCESLCAIYFAHRNYGAGTDYFEKMLINIKMEGNIGSKQTIKDIQYIIALIIVYVRDLKRSLTKNENKIQLYTKNCMTFFQ